MSCIETGLASYLTAKSAENAKPVSPAVEPRRLARRERHSPAANAPRNPNLSSQNQTSKKETAKYAKHAKTEKGSQQFAYCAYFAVKKLKAFCVRSSKDEAQQLLAAGCPLSTAGETPPTTWWQCQDAARGQGWLHTP